jgi:hypothetical protein
MLRGNPGKRRLNMAEPQPNLATGARPAVLSGEARAIWERLAPELVATDRLAIEDQEMLAPCLLVVGQRVGVRRGRRCAAGGGPENLACLVGGGEVFRTGWRPAHALRTHARGALEAPCAGPCRPRPRRRIPREAEPTARALSIPSRAMRGRWGPGGSWRARTFARRVIGMCATSPGPSWTSTRWRRIEPLISFRNSCG